MIRRNTLALLGILAALAVVALLFVIADDDVSSGRITLAAVFGAEAPQDVYVAAAPGSLVVQGFVALSLDGDKPAVLDAVQVSTDGRWFAPAAGAFVTKTVTGPPSIGPWPDPKGAPEGSYADVANYRVNPGDRRRLLVVYRAPDEDFGTWEAIALFYTVDGEHLVARTSAIRTRICVPEEANCK